MTPRLFTKAKTLALSNGHDYHLVAILQRRKQIIRVGTNSYKTHPKYPRYYRTGPKLVYHLHAEMAVLRFVQPGDKILVLRFKADGSLSMGRPCIECQKHIKAAGIREVEYSDWDGNIVRLEDVE